MAKKKDVVAKEAVQSPAEKPTLAQIMQKAQSESAFCFFCQSFAPSAMGPHCSNPKSPLFHERVRDEDTCDEFAYRGRRIPVVPALANKEADIPAQSGEGFYDPDVPVPHDDNG